ncbi:MAG TPA: universal stress protein [Vicinamibacterales bacterium]
MDGSGCFRSILCPVDFSEHSIEALRFAIGLAGRDQARLTVLTINEPLLVEAASAKCGATYLARESERELRNLVLALTPGTADWAPVPHCVVRAGKPHTEILACATEEKADLIVMGTHGLGGYRRMFFGSVTERVLQHSPILVLAVPLLAPHVVVFADRSPVFHVGHVLVPIDFGPATDYHIGVAQRVAKSFGASLLLVHVLRELRGPGGLRLAFQGRERERAEEARERLFQLASTRCGADVEVCVVSGKPADEIAEIASRHAVGLIVMGLSGGGGSESRPGSVAYRILTMSSVPVLALPPAQKEETEHSERTALRTHAV